MSKAVLISVQPKWCELIANSKKTVEVRKTRPKIETPFRCYIYCTKDKHGWFDFLKKTRLDGKVIGEFLCDSIMPYCRYEIVSGVSEVGFEELTRATQLSRKELYDYCGEKDIYCWHISDLVIYDTPKELSEFRSYNVRAYLENGHPMPTHEMKRPPQSWCYVEEEKGGGGVMAEWCCSFRCDIQNTCREYPHCSECEFESDCSFCELQEECEHEDEE